MSSLVRPFFFRFVLVLSFTHIQSVSSILFFFINFIAVFNLLSSLLNNIGVVLASLNVYLFFCACLFYVCLMFNASNARVHYCLPSRSNGLFLMILFLLLFIFFFFVIKNTSVAVTILL